ncbi:hypothetical protein BVC93_07205 [Mycobacterium sp. MS1601]|uniref:FUSC family protein n=1 Tax=Mycobacterium sp. MS1601 TaxID=1936029 RepID=UPI0009793425|nr:FUSC family protein [Mycobacterium sp. MS1601]AQA02253.1 hypothetical protein BVC93_07205 [Mycobacterium sp. MS1601]
MAAVLAVALGAVFLVCDQLGQSSSGAGVALGFVLTAVPVIPERLSAAAEVLTLRSVAVVLGAVVVQLCDGRVPVLAACTVAAAMLGAVFPKLGATAALAVVLMDLHMGRMAEPAPLPVLVLYLIGAAVVWVSVVAVRKATPVESTRSPTRAGYTHVAAMGVSVAIATAVAALVPDDVVGSHWLVTSVVLSIQADPSATGVRLAQRLSGNLVGAVLAAVILATHPSAAALVIAIVVLFLLAMALRPVNYTWWAIAGPPVLLLTSEYPAVFPWYEGGVRLLMNVVGALVVVAVVFGVPRVWRAVGT